MQATSGDRFGTWNYGDAPPRARIADRGSRDAAGGDWYASPDIVPHQPKSGLLQRFLIGLKRFGATFDERAALYGTLGFMLGMLAWHMIGFWSFVSDVVLHAPAAAVVRAPRSATANARTGPMQNMAQDAFPGLTTGSIERSEPQMTVRETVPAPLACAALELDRNSGETRRTACTGSASELKDAGHRRRGDRTATTPLLQNPIVWAAGTELRPDAVATEPAAVTEQDVDLSLPAAR